MKEDILVEISEHTFFLVAEQALSSIRVGFFTKACPLNLTDSPTLLPFISISWLLTSIFLENAVKE